MIKPNKTKYIEFCTQCNEISVFMQPWYLNSICKDNWDVSLVEKDNTIIAALVYSVIKRKGFTYIMSPSFIPAIGPYIKKNLKQKRLNRNNQERKILLHLFNQLPKYDHLSIKLSPDIIDWRSLYWKGFNQTLYFSSRIDSSKSISEVLSGSNNSVRALNKKALESLTIYSSSDAEKLYKLIEFTFKRKKQKFSLSKYEFSNLIQELEHQNKLIALIAKNNDNVDLGCIVCIEDFDTVYYMFGGFDNSTRIKGSQTALIIKAIEISNSKLKDFDFEGSMVESIAKFFLSFDSDILPYSVIGHTPSKVLKVKQLLKG